MADTLVGAVEAAENVVRGVDNASERWAEVASDIAPALEILPLRLSQDEPDSDMASREGAYCDLKSRSLLEVPNLEVDRLAEMPLDSLSVSIKPAAANALAVPNHIIAPEDSKVWLRSLFVQVRSRRLIPFTYRQCTRPSMSKPALVPPTPVDARSRIV